MDPSITSRTSPPVDSTAAMAMPDSELLLERHSAIAHALEHATNDVERARIKEDIVALFRDSELALQAVRNFKESVKHLATQWKQTGRASIGSGSATSQRIDHLGASTFVEKGWSMISFGDAIGAEKALRRALELVPAANEAETLLGWAQMLQDNYDGALLTFHNVLMRDPQNALARTNVGYVCLRKKIYGEAIEHLASAIRLNADARATLYAHLYMGQVYYEREMYDDAAAFFGKALELGPGLLQAWYELGRTLWYADRHDAAQDAWRAGANANKFNPWGKRCAELLKVVEAGGVAPR